MRIIKRKILLTIIFFCTLIWNQTFAQELKMTVNLSTVDGIEISPDNIFNFQIISNESRTRNVSITGTLIYRNSKLRMSYSFSAMIHPGMNSFSKSVVTAPQWSFSDNALRELFFDYKKLPQGTYEYCVEIGLDRKLSEEQLPIPVGECVYYTVNDVFLINLITPENDAELYEYNPLLSWMVNFHAPGLLTYKLRLTDVKEGQNNQSAINRNNLIYKENNVISTSQIYPVTAKPLKAFQPYVWTVDAYYKGILLGGAEPWRFTIIEDSFLEASIPKDVPYLDIRLEKVIDPVFAIGKLKMKYELRDLKVDTLQLRLVSDGKEIKLKNNKIETRAGDNRLELDLTSAPRLRHFKIYTMYINNLQGEKFTVSFRYVNPDFVK